MTIDILPRLSWWIFKNHWLINMAFAIHAICYALIIYKLYTSKDGAFRRYLLLLFSAYAFNASVQMIFYNPFFNNWVQATGHIPGFVALLLFTWFIVRHFGIGGGKHE